MTYLLIFQQLLKIGIAGDFEKISSVISRDNERVFIEVTQVLCKRDEMVSFAESLSISDRVSFVKAITIIEKSIGGVGSTTTLEYLLPLLEEEENRIFCDWVLVHIPHYYYSHFPHSIEGREEHSRRMNISAGQHRAHELNQQKARNERLAHNATNQIFNAVRRKDIAAVTALLAKGANPNITRPDQLSLLEFAREIGVESITQQIENSIDGKHSVD